METKVIKVETTTGTVDVLLDEDVYKALNGKPIVPFYRPNGRIRAFGVGNVSLHKFVAKVKGILPPDGADRIDHKNRNVADNRGSNLRWSNASLNGMNLGQEIPGLHWDATGHEWHVNRPVPPEKLGEVQWLIGAKFLKGSIGKPHFHGTYGNEKQAKEEAELINSVLGYRQHPTFNELQVSNE